MESLENLGSANQGKAIVRKMAGLMAINEKKGKRKDNFRHNIYFYILQ